MNRRRLLLASGALPIASFAWAQSSERVRRVQMLFVDTRAEAEPFRKALVEGLQAHSWSVGRNLQLEGLYAEGRQENLAPLAAKIVDAKPDVIVVLGPAPAVEVKKLGSPIPVVFFAVFNPIAIGLAQSLARPGGSFTGFSTAVPERFFTKQVELLREAVPNLTRLGVLTNPKNPIHTESRDRLLKQIRDLRMEPIEVHAATGEEIEPAFREANSRGAQAMFVGGDPLQRANRALTAELALRYRVPTLFLYSFNVEAGGLMSYAANMADLSRRSADYVDRILRGAKPADLPIQQPVNFELAINLKTAKALGLKIPQSLLLRADRVIE